VPPLRERREDVPLLAEHFMGEFARQMDRHIHSVPQELIDRMTRHSWPGNIRELENFIERAVILSHGEELNTPPGELETPFSEPAPAEPLTLKDAQRAHIVRTLRETNGIIGAAAHRLGVPRSTLFYKMRRLGITARPEPN
jgi:formate hydrogenlyase transcriptional activator